MSDEKHARTNENVPSKAYTKPSVPWARGYFAFPPVVTPDGRIEFIFTANQPQEDEEALLREREAEAAREAEEARKEQAWQERCRRDAQIHEECLARERAEALIGEMAWVRAGLSLRDENGRRDMVRTEQLRAEVRLLDAEERLMSHWNAYQARWRTLLATSTPVAFADIPWPLYTSPKSVEELVPSAIEEFLMGPLKVRKNTVTRRERVRASLLRWHPDKLSALLMRVVQEDEVVVRDGINAVFRSLKALQDGERQS